MCAYNYIQSKDDQLKVKKCLCNYPPYISPLTPYYEINEVYYFSHQDFVITKN